MAQSRLMALTLLAGALLVTHTQTARSQYGSTSPTTPIEKSAPAVGANDSTCVVYPLSGLGDDPVLAKWIADTIPEVILPATWSQAGGVGRISYYAPGKVLVVNHTRAVHAKVDAFLKDLKKALPPEKAMAAASKADDGQVVQAEYRKFTPIKRAESAAAAPSTYLVPPPLQQPKHLFHLIIRYEGDGLGDSTVAGFVKELAGDSPRKQDGADEGNARPAKTLPLGQLLHMIVRYEGDGIIDSNVAALVKDIYGASKNWAGPVSVSQGPAEALGGGIRGGALGLGVGILAPTPANIIWRGSGTPATGIPSVSGQSAWSALPPPRRPRRARPCLPPVAPADAKHSVDGRHRSLTLSARRFTPCARGSPRAAWRWKPPCRR